MKIVVDASMLDGGPSGAATRLTALASAHAASPDLAITYLVRPATELLSGQATVSVAGIDTPWGRARAGSRLDAILRAERADLFMAGALPLPRITAVPTVVTIHDLRFLDDASRPSWLRRLWGRHRLGPNLSRAAALVAVSETTAARLRAVSSVPVHVVANAATPGLERVTDPDRIAGFRRRAELNFRYALVLGPLAVHKAPGFALAVLAAVRSHAAGADLGLVFAGRADPEATSVVAREAERLGLETAVRFVGPLDDDDLALAFSGADALLACGRCEGFAIPVVDAQRLGLPVVATEAGALPEVAGNGAWFAAPDDVPGCAAALLDAITPSDLGEARRAQGLTLADRWSWEASARRLEALWRGLVASSAEAVL